MRINSDGVPQRGGQLSGEVDTPAVLEIEYDEVARAVTLHVLELTSPVDDHPRHVPWRRCRERLSRILAKDIFLYYSRTLL